MAEPCEAAATARSVLARALQLDESEVSPTTSMSTSDRWDSLAHMRLILELEAALGRELSSEEMLAIECHDDIVRLIGP